MAKEDRGGRRAVSAKKKSAGGEGATTKIAISEKNKKWLNQVARPYFARMENAERKAKNDREERAVRTQREVFTKRTAKTLGVTEDEAREILKQKRS